MPRLPPMTMTRLPVKSITDLPESGPALTDAPAASVLPHAWKNSPRPPNVPVPKLSAGTLKPDAPNRLYSMPLLPVR